MDHKIFAGQVNHSVLQRTDFASKSIPNLILLLLFILLFLAVAPSFSQEQKQDHIVYGSTEWAPFDYTNEAGEVTGLYVDILYEIFTVQLNLPVRTVFKPWARTQEEIKEGVSDFTITVATPERLTWSVKCDQPVLEMFIYVYTYKGHPKLELIQTIKTGMDIKKLELTPVTNIGNNWHKINIDDHGVDTHYVPSEKNSFMFLAAKRADITIEPLFAGSYLINKLNLADKIIPTDARFGPIVFDLLISKKSRYAKDFEKINKATKEVVESQRYQRIIDSYGKIR
jgi:polar amino acid transport system substrate-binding protein